MSGWPPIKLSRSTSMDDLILRSRGDSVRSAGSRLTSNSQGRPLASSITSKPKSWKQLVLGSPRAAAGRSARQG